MQLKANRPLRQVRCLAKILQIIAYYEAIICLKFYLLLLEAVLLAFRAAGFLAADFLFGADRFGALRFGADLLFGALRFGADLLFGADRFGADLIFGADLLLTALVDRFAIANLLNLLVFLW